MSQLTHEQYLRLKAMGKEPLDEAAEINFGGNEKLQKTPGMHHLPQYRSTGTFHLPQLVEARKRRATDAAKRLLEGKMTEVELRKWGGISGLQEKLAEHKLRIDDKKMTIANMYAEMLMQEYEAKKKDRQEERVRLEIQTGKKIEEVLPEPVNPREDLVRAAEKAALTKVTGDSDLSSNKDESVKDVESQESPKEQAEDTEPVLVEA